MLARKALCSLSPLPSSHCQGRKLPLWSRMDGSLRIVESCPVVAPGYTPLSFPDYCLVDTDQKEKARSKHASLLSITLRTHDVTELQRAGTAIRTRTYGVSQGEREGLTVQALPAPTSRSSALQWSTWHTQGKRGLSGFPGSPVTAGPPGPGRGTLFLAEQQLLLVLATGPSPDRAGLEPITRRGQKACDLTPAQATCTAQAREGHGSGADPAPIPCLKSLKKGRQPFTPDKAVSFKRPLTSSPRSHKKATRRTEATTSRSEIGLGLRVGGRHSGQHRPTWVLRWRAKRHYGKQ